jgi:hypothetical protein
MRREQSIERVREALKRSLGSADWVNIFRKHSRAGDRDLRILLALVQEADLSGIFTIDVVRRGAEFGCKPRRIIAALRRALERNEIMRLSELGPESNRYQILVG